MEAHRRAQLPNHAQLQLLADFYDDLEMFFPAEEQLVYCTYSTAMQAPEIAIKILEVVDEQPSFDWCNELLRTGKSPPGMSFCGNSGKLILLTLKDKRFFNQGAILRGFIQRCRPQPAYKRGFPNTLAFNSGRTLPMGRKVGILGRNRIATTHMLFASGAAFQIIPVTNGMVKIPQIAGRVGVIALVGTPTMLWLAMEI
jgi:hypothetical protein